ncbi:hypothetical protein HDU76_012127, partial [Blyttiomyces sp. JEL0837]
SGNTGGHASVTTLVSPVSPTTPTTTTPPTMTRRSSTLSTMTTATMVSTTSNTPTTTTTTPSKSKKDKKKTDFGDLSSITKDQLSSVAPPIVHGNIFNQMAMQEKMAKSRETVGRGGSEDGGSRVSEEKSGAEKAKGGATGLKPKKSIKRA